MRKVMYVLIAALVWASILAGPAGAQTATGTGDESVLVRVNGNVTVPEGESHGVVVVVNGDLTFAGDANTVVVVDGSAEFLGATVETLVVVSSGATLGPETVITGDVYTVDATLMRDPGAVVRGTIQEEVAWEVASGFWLLGVLLTIGWALLVLFGGQVMAAVAPEFARRAGRTLSTEVGATIGAGLVLWIALPIVGGLLFATVVGIPIALTIFLVILPAMGFIGFLVSGIRLGEYVVAREGGVGHPFLAAFLGLLMLIVVGLIPALGPAIVLIAGFLGSGALALMAIRSMRTRPAPVEEPLQQQ